MPRRIVEASIFWHGELVAVKQLRSMDELDLPATGDVVVRTRLCDVAPRRRSPIDLPLGALGVVAALVHLTTVASFTSAPEPHPTGEARGTHSASYVVTTDPAPAFDAVASAPAKPVHVDTNRGCSGVADYLMVNHLKHMQL